MLRGVKMKVLAILFIQLLYFANFRHIQFTPNYKLNTLNSITYSLKSICITFYNFAQVGSDAMKALALKVEATISDSISTSSGKLAVVVLENRKNSYFTILEGTLNHHSTRVPSKTSYSAKCDSILDTYLKTETQIYSSCQNSTYIIWRCQSQHLVILISSCGKWNTKKMKTPIFLYESALNGKEIKIPLSLHKEKSTKTIFFLTKPSLVCSAKHT